MKMKSDNPVISVTVHCEVLGVAIERQGFTIPVNMTLKVV